MLGYTGPAKICEALKSIFPCFIIKYNSPIWINLTETFRNSSWEKKTFANLILHILQCFKSYYGFHSSTEMKRQSNVNPTERIFHQRSVISSRSVDSLYDYPTDIVIQSWRAWYFILFDLIPLLYERNTFEVVTR